MPRGRREVVRADAISRIWVPDLERMDDGDDGRDPRAEGWS